MGVFVYWLIMLVINDSAPEESGYPNSFDICIPYQTFHDFVVRFSASENLQEDQTDLSSEFQQSQVSAVTQFTSDNPIASNHSVGRD